MKKNKNQHRVQDILKLIRTERDPYFWNGPLTATTITI